MTKSTVQTRAAKKARLSIAQKFKALARDKKTRTLKDFAAAIGCSTPTLKRAHGEFRIQLRLPDLPKQEQVSDNQVKEIVQLARKGFRAAEISDSVGASKRQVYRACKTRKVKLTSDWEFPRNLEGKEDVPTEPPAGYLTLSQVQAQHGIHPTNFTYWNRVGCPALGRPLPLSKFRLLDSFGRVQDVPAVRREDLQLIIESAEKVVAKRGGGTRTIYKRAKSGGELITAKEFAAIVGDDIHPKTVHYWRRQGKECRYGIVKGTKVGKSKIMYTVATANRVKRKRDAMFIPADEEWLSIRDAVKFHPTWTEQRLRAALKEINPILGRRIRSEQRLGKRENIGLYAEEMTHVSVADLKAIEDAGSGEGPPASPLDILPPLATAANGNPVEDIWPPDGGWHFRPGLVAFRGQMLPLRGKLWAVLFEFCQSRFPLSREQLRAKVWRDNSDVEDPTIKQTVYLLRKKLQKWLELGELDPFPSVDQTGKAAWEFTLRS